MFKALDIIKNILFEAAVLRAAPINNPHSWVDCSNFEQGFI